MRFIIDAHLPNSLKAIFISHGYEAIHVSELPNGNATSDQELTRYAGTDGVIVSKDEDFYQSFLLHGKPPKLVHVKIGNMRLQQTTQLFKTVAPQIIQLLLKHDLIELFSDKIIVVK